MEFRISDAAFDFFESMQPENKSIRIRGKVYGSTNIHDGFSVALETGVPDNPLMKAEKGDVLVYAEKNDEWFFAGYDLEIDYNEDEQMVTYFFVEED